MAKLLLDVIRMQMSCMNSSGGLGFVALRFEWMAHQGPTTKKEPLMDSSEMKKGTKQIGAISASHQERMSKLVKELCCGMSVQEQQSYYNYALYKSGYFQQIRKHANWLPQYWRFISEDFFCEWFRNDFIEVKAPASSLSISVEHQDLSFFFRQQVTEFCFGILKLKVYIFCFAFQNQAWVSALLTNVCISSFYWQFFILGYFAFAFPYQSKRCSQSFSWLRDGGCISFLGKASTCRDFSNRFPNPPDQLDMDLKNR